MKRAPAIYFKFNYSLSLAVTEVVTVWVWFKPDCMKNKKQNTNRYFFPPSPINFQFKT